MFHHIHLLTATSAAVRMQRFGCAHDPKSRPGPSLLSRDGGHPVIFPPRGQPFVPKGAHGFLEMGLEKAPPVVDVGLAFTVWLLATCGLKSEVKTDQDDVPFPPDIGIEMLQKVTAHHQSRPRYDDSEVWGA